MVRKEPCCRARRVNKNIYRIKARFQKSNNLPKNKTENRFIIGSQKQEIRNLNLMKLIIQTKLHYL